MITDTLLTPVSFERWAQHNIEYHHPKRTPYHQMSKGLPLYAWRTQDKEEEEPMEREDDGNDLFGDEEEDEEEDDEEAHYGDAPRKKDKKKKEEPEVIKEPEYIQPQKLVEQAGIILSLI